MALFQNPQDIAMAQELALRQGASSSPTGPQDILRGSIFNLGNVGGNAIQRGVTGSPMPNPAQQRAAGLQGFLQNIDLTNPASIQKGMNVLNKAGFQAEAFKLAELLPSGSDKAMAIGSPYIGSIEDERNPGNYVLQRLQRWSDGSVKSIGTALNSETVTTPGSAETLPDSVFGGISVREEDAENMIGRLSSLPEFQSMLPGMDVNLETLKPFVGEIKSTTYQLKSEALAKALPLYEQGMITGNQMKQLFGPVADQRWLRAGYSKFIKGGGLQKSIDPSTIGADTPQVQGTVDATSLPFLNSNQAFGEELEQEQDRIGLDDRGNIAGMVLPRPGEGGFRLGAIDPTIAAPVFSQIDKLDNMQMKQVLENQGFTFSPNVFAAHAKAWNVMRENPELVKQYVSQLEFPTQAASFKRKKLVELFQGLNAPAMASAQYIFAYFKNIGKVPTAADKNTKPFLTGVESP